MCEEQKTHSVEELVPRTLTLGILHQENWVPLRKNLVICKGIVLIRSSLGHTNPFYSFPETLNHKLRKALWISYVLLLPTA